MVISIWRYCIQYYYMRASSDARKNVILPKRKSCIIDLFSLYAMFSHFRPRDVTRGNSFFQMSSYARANVRITIENSHEGITCSKIGKLKVYHTLRSSSSKYLRQICKPTRDHDFITFRYNFFLIHSIVK